jgi:hypothetical protein
MKRIKLILAVIALIALAGSLWMACDSGGGMGGDGDSTISGWNGGKRPSGGNAGIYAPGAAPSGGGGGGGTEQGASGTTP